MKTLIERLERTTGPNRELDEAIFEFVHDRKRHRSTFEQYEPSEKLPAYTESIDAALTLKPGGWFATITTGGLYPTGEAVKPSVNLAEPIQTKFGAGVGIRAQAQGANPAIALCIAALKAADTGNRFGSPPIDDLPGESR